VDWAIFLLGPFLIVLATLLITFVVYTGFGILLPSKAAFLSWQWFGYVGTGLFLLFNILFNYFMCVTTNPGTHDCPAYLRLLDDARGAGKVIDDAGAGGVVGDSRDVAGEGDSDEETLVLMRRAKRKGGRGRTASPASSGGGSHGGGSQGSWMDLQPDEWGWCHKSNMPKAPRAHYCHVTRKLVLNMDHYCPWMFNCVGWLNYRYFLMFLFYMLLGCSFSALCASEAFFDRRISFAGGRKARSNVTFMFVLSASVCIAVGILFFWHCYLVLSAQTTIEFYGNITRGRRARSRGEMYSNPYDCGWRKNLAHVLGDMPLWLAVLPSDRTPPGKPWPERLAYPARTRPRDTIV
jgi:palmitoyltransferase